jgi:mRNA interferase HigB
MRLVGRQALDGFAVRHAEIRLPLQAWIAEVEEADWQGPNDIKARYPSASFIAGNTVVFNIKGNKYRIETKVNYAVKVVLATRIGTHAEYARWNV